MITLGGVDLVIPDQQRELVRWLEQYLPLSDLRDQSGPVALQSQRTQSRSGFKPGVGLPLPNYPAPPTPKLNTLYWPTGASRWARGYFLATSNQLEEILGEIGNSNTAIDLVLEDEDNEIEITASVYLLPPRPITAGLAESPLENLYLLPLVDQRYYWQWKHADNLEIDHESDWDYVFSTLGTRLGVSVSVDPFVGDYKVPDIEEFTRRYENAAVLLDAAAHSTGRRIVVNLDGSVLAMGFQAAETKLETNLERYALIAGGAIDFHPSAVTPAKVLVTFPKYYDHHVDSDGEVFTVEVDPTDSDTPVTPDTVKVIHSTAFADFTTRGTDPDNETDLNELAELIAGDFYAGLTHFDRTFPSLSEWEPTSFDDYIEFSFGALVGHDWLAHTRVASRPYNFGEEEQLQQFEDLVALGDHQIGVTDEAIGKGAEGPVKVYSGAAGSETDSLLSITAFNKFADVDDETAVAITWMNNYWYLVASECTTGE